MFTGIIQGLAVIESAQRLPGLTKLTCKFPQHALTSLQRGASIALNGVCLTVTDYNDQQVSFDVMSETLRTTNLAAVNEGDKVNFERAARIGDEIGGHLVSGHIHTKAKIISRNDTANNCTLLFQLEQKWAKYIIPKGFITVNGASLTVGSDVTNDRFSVHLIPETLSVTTFGTAKAGDTVNIEIDTQTQTIVDTIERLGLKLNN
jgi:riboflavin synthase